MDLPTKCIQEYKDIYKTKYGVELSDGEAEIRAENMLKLMICLTKSDNENQNGGIILMQPENP